MTPGRARVRGIPGAVKTLCEACATLIISTSSVFATGTLGSVCDNICLVRCRPPDQVKRGKAWNVRSYSFPEPRLRLRPSP
jgi:hypothetical protein